MAAYLCAAMVLMKYRAMHNYNKVEKEIIDLLRDQDVRDIKLLGNTIQKAFSRTENYVVRKMRKTQYKLKKLYLVATYCDEANQEWHMLMPDELREALSSNCSILTWQRKGRKDQLLSSSA